MNISVVKKTVQLLIDRLDGNLEKKGFVRSDKTAKESVAEWNRVLNWRTEKVTVLFKWDKDIYISFSVLFPKSGTKEDRQYLIFDQTQSGKLVGESGQHYRVPFLGLSAPSFVESTIKKVDSVFSWFDEYDSIQKCLKKLKKNFENRPGSEAEEELEAYLKNAK